MMRLIGYFFVCGLLVTGTVFAQKESDYRTGRVVKVTGADYVDPGGKGQIAFLLHIQDGTQEIFGKFTVNILFGHDSRSEFKPNADVPYRISGKSLFVKTAANKEIKGHVCERVSWRGTPAIKCGGDVMTYSEGEESQTK
jgi:hypothetical protein